MTRASPSTSCACRASSNCEVLSRICCINVHVLTAAQCVDLPSLVFNHNLTRAIINCDVYTIWWQRRIAVLVEEQELQMWPSGTKCECTAINTVNNLKAHRWRRVHCNASAPDGTQFPHPQYLPRHACHRLRSCCFSTTPCVPPLSQQQR